MLIFDIVFLFIKVFYYVFKTMFDNIRGVKERDVSNDIVLITGTGHGIGKELAQQYAKLGATVVCWDVNEPTNQETVKLIKSRGGKAHGYT